MIEFPYGDGLEVALGGGRKMFFPNTWLDPEEKYSRGLRKDGRNLVNEWLQKSNKHAYVWNKAGFDNLNITSDDHILGKISVLVTMC